MKHYRRFVMMRPVLVTALLGGVALLVFSCATVPSGPPAPGEVRLTGINVPHEGGCGHGIPKSLGVP